MPFHFLWLATLAMFLGLPALVVVGIVILLAGGRSGRHPSPLFSPDGRWWWDGAEWKPVPQQQGPTPPATPASGSGS
ncbi:MAG TPA: hypothetical protein VET26_07305 [Candidatus Sulfotelmatobacter sp.]|nr:hypothetical protein [Candidatus Sulfotelmatobacter sp.]